MNGHCPTPQEDRSFQLADSAESTSSVAVGFSRSLSRRTDLNLSSSMRLSGADTTWNSQIRLTHTLGESLRGTLSYARQLAAVGCCRQ